MRRIVLGAFLPRPASGASLEKKMDWAIRSILSMQDNLREIERASQDIDALTIADGFTITNLTADRVLDADSTTLDEVADVLGTLIRDMKTRGSKRTST